jgi:hypothetical protein
MEGVCKTHINTTRTLYTDTATQTGSARDGRENQTLIDVR